MKNKTSIFIDRLQSLKNISNKSYNHIEKDLGYPRNALQNYRTGTNPSALRLIELANYFGVSPDYLIGEEQKSEQKSIKIIFETLDDNQKKELIIICQQWLLMKL